MFATVVESVAELYNKMGREILDHGSTVSPRGLETKEILCPMIEITDPRSRLAYNKERNFSIVYAVTESLMIFSSSNDVKYFSHLNKTMEQFSDEGKYLHGCYGRRVNSCWQTVIDKLKKDDCSRQAVLNIYNNGHDAWYDGKDCPCTISMSFIIRDNKLHMTTHMRSNDIVWGLPYDIYMFTVAQEVIANELGVDVGSYYHLPISLHVYEKHYDILETMVDNCFEVRTQNSNTLEQIRTQASDYEHAVDWNYGISDKQMRRAKGHDQHERREVNILFNEMLHRAGKKVHWPTPAWANQFVHRWEVE